MKQHESMIAVRFRLEGTLYIQILVSAVIGMFFAQDREQTDFYYILDDHGLK
jgi:hypothetical protein